MVLRNKHWIVLAGLALGLLIALPVQASNNDALLGRLPAQLQAFYVGADVKLHPSPYESLREVEEPWKWCFSGSYQGNPWRVAVATELRRLVEGLNAAGIEATFEMTSSNNNVTRQISQIHSFINKGCSIITAIAGSPTALNGVIKDAHDAGIPFITAAGGVTSPYAINVDSNYVKWGYDMMKQIAEKTVGKAKVLMVEGIAGNPITAKEYKGAQKALNEISGLQVIRRVNGNWTANVTKQVVLQTLATYPGTVDAVWTTGSEARVIAVAFNQAGREAPLITGSITGDILGYWKANPNEFHYIGYGVLPKYTAQTLFRVATRVLLGQQPKLNTLMIPLPRVEETAFAQWYAPCMTLHSTTVFPVPPEDPMPTELLAGYFENPAPVPGWDYKNTPKA